MFLSNSVKPEIGVSVVKNQREKGAVRISILTTASVFIAMLLGLSFAGATSSHATTRQDLTDIIATLNSKVSTLQSKTDTLTVDVNKLLKKLALTNVNQSAIFVVGISTGIAGSQIQIPITYLTGPVPVTGLQVDIVLPSSFTIVSIVAGPVAIQANKSVQTNISGPAARVIIFGLNQTPMLSGVLATMTIQSTAISPKGSNQIIAVSPVATDAAGNPTLLTVTSGSVGIK